MSEEHIEARRGFVGVAIGTSHEEIEPEHYTPAEARALANRIIAEADKCDAQKAAIVAACADGHDWSSGYNAYRTWPDERICVYWCNREGCDARREEDGWMQFASQLHIRFGRQVPCTGPGCDHCDEERLGRAASKLLGIGIEALVGAAHTNPIVWPTAKEETP